MRTLPVFVALLLVPTSVATHPVPLDPASLAEDGAELVVFLDVSGRNSGSSVLRQEWNGGEDWNEGSGTWSHKYAWSATAWLEKLETPRPDGWTHATRAYANITMSYEDNGAGSTGQEGKTTGRHENSCKGAGVQPAFPVVLGRVLDGKIHIRFEGMQLYNPSRVNLNCRSSSTDHPGGTTYQDDLPPATLPGSPVITGPLAPLNASHLDLAFDATSGRETLVGSWSGGAAKPGDRGAPMYYCGMAHDGEVKKCSASGTIEASVLVDPCKMLRESLAHHIGVVQAIRPPAKGSSESQVRAFTVDARQKLGALLADEHQIQLICGETTVAGMAAAAAVQEMIAKAWLDVERTHGLSKDGIRDALGAERASQLIGNEIGSAPGDFTGSIERLGIPDRLGHASVRSHSPVALHAWDEDGRHVGWNASTGTPDLGVPNATYDGEPGSAQTLMLPAGVYRVAVDELGTGTYTLNVTAANATTYTPMRSAEGGASSLVLLVDHLGAMTLASARGAQADGFLGVGELRSTVTPLDEGTRDTPPAGPALAAALAFALALALGLARRNKDRPRSR